MQTSPLFEGTSKILRQRIEHELESQGESSELTERQVLDRMATLAPAEKAIAASLVQRTAFELSQSLAPLLGESQQGATRANLVFGLGVFGMGFSTIIILMLINGFVFCEATGQRLGGATHVAGCLVAGISGAAWPLVWSGGSKIWLAVFVSTFAFLLLPIAYCTFMMMMNSQRILGDQMPRGLRRLVWNTLMGISVVAVVAAALTTITDKVFDPANPLPGKIALGVLIVYVVLVVIGFFLRPPQRQ
jgi:hypothetical protein